MAFKTGTIRAGPALRARRFDDDEEDEDDEPAVVQASIGAVDFLTRELNFFGLTELRVIYFLALQLGVLRGDWVFCGMFLGSLPLVRSVEAPDFFALLAAIVTTGLFSPLLEAGIGSSGGPEAGNLALVAALGALGIAALVSQPAYTIASGSADALLPEEKELLDVRERKQLRETEARRMGLFDRLLKQRDERLREQQEDDGKDR